MIISDILEKSNRLKVETVRESSQDYDERVILLEDLDQWKAILTEFLGTPLKSPGERITKQGKNLTANNGGLFDDQTLFYRKFEEYSVIAMFWPWKDKMHVTLKMVSIKE